MNYDELLAPAAKLMRPSGIRKFFDLAAEMPHCISLGVGEPDFKTPWTIRDAGIRSLEQGRTRYTANAGIKELRAEICRYLARRMELNYQPSEVLVTVGGSADAAGVLVGLNELYNAQLSMSELCAIGAGIGADVPFALMGGTCRVKGVGDLIKPLPPCPDCWFVVVMPSVGISTPEAFKRYDIMGSPVHPDCERQEQAIRENDLAAMCTAAGNALEHCSGAVETAAICKQLNAQGAVTSLMTGSGAAVFGVFDDGQKAKQAQQALQAGYDQVYLARPVRGGARVLPRPAKKDHTPRREK